MTFAEAARRDSTFTTTENGAFALNTTGDATLDLYSTIGALRNADDERIFRLFSEAYKEDPLFATKIVFYARDIREGLGERKVFRTLLKYISRYHPEALINNLHLIGLYGRYDDLYSLVGTPLENDMWDIMKHQFELDVANMKKGKSISLLAKWIKTPDASSKQTRKLGILTASKLGYSVYKFKRLLRTLRKYISIVEVDMSAKKWDEIVYSKVPSRAMMIYRNAFNRHDHERYTKYIQDALQGKETIHSDTLYPYDIIEKYIYDRSGNTYIYKRSSLTDNDKMVLEAQWRQLPVYLEKPANVMVIADTSGSMHGRPLATSIGLAVYFAERNKGAYHNMFMIFSAESKIVSLKGETLEEKIRDIESYGYIGNNTNLESAFNTILNIAIENSISQDEMPESVVVVSDMEIDQCNSEDWLFYKYISKKYADAGYTIPNVVFWNVNSRHDIFHVDSERKGVQCVSGQSPSIFKNVIDSIGMTPMEAMHKAIDSERYIPITIANK